MAEGGRPPKQILKYTTKKSTTTSHRRSRQDADTPPALFIQNIFLSGTSYHDNSVNIFGAKKSTININEPRDIDNIPGPSTSGYDVGLFCSASNKQMLTNACLQKLNENQYKTIVVHENHMQTLGQTRIQTKVFLLTMSFFKHTLLPNTETIAAISSESTLMLARGVHLRKFKTKCRELFDKHQPKVVEVFNTDIVDIILNFLQEKKQIQALNESINNLQLHTETEAVVQKQEFLQIVEHFSRRQIFLIALGTIPQPQLYHKAFTNIPWLKAFDFDQNSLDSGLISNITTNHNTPYTISRLSEPPKPLNENSTDWCIVDDKSTRKDQVDHIDPIVEFCCGYKTTTLIIPWYHKNQDDMNDKICQFALKLSNEFDRFPRRPRCILCLPKNTRDIFSLRTLTMYQNFEVVCLDLKSLVTCFEECNAMRLKFLRNHVKIPKLPDEPEDADTVEITNSTLAGLKKCIEILSIDDYVLEENCQEQGLQFLKGGNLTFDILQDGTFYAERDIVKKVVRYIKENKNVIKDIVKIMHLPGSGGSTVGKRVIWELKGIMPCIYVPQSTDINEDLKENIKMIRDLSGMSPMIFLDNHSEQDAKELKKLCYFEEPTILLVQRIFGELPRSMVHGCFYLHDEVNKNEAESLCRVYSQHATEGAKTKLKKLSKATKDKFLYEFGLTAFDEDYSGVKDYVKGRLQLNGDLLPWQKVIGYLALAQYYGQYGIPSEMFSSRLGVSVGTVRLEVHMEKPCRSLVSEDENGAWKITHFIVAREILEQILNRISTPTPTSPNYLSPQATAGLTEFVLDFLDLFKPYVQHLNIVPRHILPVYLNIFIRRTKNVNYETVSAYAKVFTDVMDEKKQEKIFLKICEVFRNHADSYAQLGRFYGKHNNHEQAIECHEKAIRMRKAQVSAHKCDDTLSRLYSMYGNCYNRYINDCIRKITRGQDNDVETQSEFIWECVEISLRQFYLCRENDNKKLNPTYGYTGEVRLRLSICELVSYLRNYFQNLIPPKWSVFVAESFGICKQLFEECLYFENNANIFNVAFMQCVDKYVRTYKKHQRELVLWTNDIGVTLTKYICQLSLFKEEFSTDQKFKVLKNIPNYSNRVVEFIRICKHIVDHGLNDKQAKVSLYVDELLQAYRHNCAERMELKEIQHLVTKWKNKREPGSLANYYTYVVNFILALRGEQNIDQVNSQFDSMREFQKQMPSNVLKTSREFIPRNIQSDDLEFKDSLLHYHVHNINEDLSRFEIFTERIDTYKNANLGKIKIKTVNQKGLNVYFHPRTFGITKHDGERRAKVEFVVGFNPRRGAEAYRLYLIRSLQCTCGNIIDVRDADYNNPDIALPRCQNCNAALQRN